MGSITHAFVSAIPDGADATVVRPSNWNDVHTFSLASSDLTDVTPFGTSLVSAANAAAGRAILGAGTGSGTVTNVATGTGLTGGPITTTGTIALADTAVTPGGYGSATQASTFTVDQQGRLTAAGQTTITPAVGSITGLGTGVATFLATPSSANLAAAVTDETGSGALVFAVSPALTGNPTVPTQATSDNSTKAASTAFVTTAISNAIAGVNPAVAVQAATTAAGDTSGLAYNNGASGIGATLTGSNNTTITIDGYTFTALGQRLLVKNDTQSPSGAFNGVYYVTQVQTAILPPILSRALDYDQPSDINNTGAIPVVNGTVNANTSWLLTSAVTTVGTDPLTYAQFSIAPSSIVTLTGTQTLTNKRVTKRAPSITQSATPTINTDATDYAEITGLAQDITSMTTNLSGTPVKGDTLWVSITGTATRAITWGTSFEASTVALPTTTVSTARLDIGFMWNVATSKWRCVAAA